MNEKGETTPVTPQKIEVPAFVSDSLEANRLEQEADNASRVAEAEATKQAITEGMPEFTPEPQPEQPEPQPVIETPQDVKDSLEANRLEQEADNASRVAEAEATKQGIIDSMPNTTQE